MAVIRNLLIFGLCYLSFISYGQNNSLKFDTTEVTIDFLSSYYSQEGDNSPVTGGVGTEELTTADNRIVVSSALDSVHQVKVKQGVNVITSASTDRIDGVSSASKEDIHASFAVSYSKINVKKRSIRTLKGSLSSESDYSSKGLGYSLEKLSENGNHRIGVAANAFFDDWVIIFPEELREDTANFPTKDFRNSYSLNFYGKNVINKRMLFHWQLGGTIQNGLLSTPFHRVYFKDTISSGLEALPTERLKIPITLGVNIFVFHNLIIKPKYRFYVDTYGVLSNTFSLQTILKLSPFFSVKGTVRYANQRGSKYFKGFAEHSFLDQYRTSDHDLDSFSSIYSNIGLSYAPIKGVFSSKRFSLKTLEIRYARFKRSNNLRSDLISAWLSFRMKDKT